MYIKLIKNRKESPEKVTITLSDRLPTHIQGPVEVHCEYRLRPESDFFLLDLNIQAKLNFDCLRCGEGMSCDFLHTCLLAVFSSEERASELAQEYDAIVAVNGELDLAQVLIDELILYAPERHEIPEDCRISV